MSSVQIASATTAPPIIPLALQADRIRRRISASDAVAAVIAEMAYGAHRRADHGDLVAITAERVGASMMGARS